MAGPRLDEVKDNAFRLSSRLNSTWGGNFTDMVRSTHYLRIIEEEHLVENAAKVGAYFLDQLRDLQREEPMISAARGRGLFLAFDLPDPKTREEFWKGFFDLGVLTLRSGENSIRFRPALDITADVIDEAMDLMRKQCQPDARRWIALRARRRNRRSRVLVSCNPCLSRNSASPIKIRASFAANGAAAAARSTKSRRLMGGSSPACSTASDDDYDNGHLARAGSVLKWRTTPGPVRGETVRRLGNALART